MALVDRVKNILLTPREEWQVIDAEPATPSELYKEYIIPLAAIGPVASALGALVFGYQAFGMNYRPPIGTLLASAIVTLSMRSDRPAAAMPSRST